ncbi:zinc finger, BED-type, Zinc finger, C2H2, WD40/YVTN repeat-like-containing domain protein [Artemisia annua]|uniref:Zinc finger, BED-type, Zinc finger, C2H2, WD40/YVTN repeat-like-containing domain protein n=1 Tax=Artemisia annua TaxID=35608 RepID=A0A2U1KC20_ARTAN|nr:zinc finger, BED-type, Zinc finger, C2H2, WD40/YVTN repeat-like-containing domain protein [Artemisia annua]
MTHKMIDYEHQSYGYDCSNMEIVSTLDVDEPVTQFKKSVSPNQGKLRSKVWKHFKKHFKPNNEAVAICNYCSRSFSGGVTAGTSHLRNHVERKHAQFVFPEVHNHMDSVSTPNGDSTSSDWDHYKKFKKPNNDIVGVCDFCSKNIVVRDGESYKLKNHLKRKHLKLIKSIASSKTESVSILKLEEPMTEVEESSPPSQGKNKVMDWAHFQKVENSNNKIVAVCKHCSKNLVLGDDESTKLRNHLNRKHAELISSIDCIKTEDVSTPDVDEPMTEVEEVDPSSQRSLGVSTPDVDDSMAMTSYCVKYILIDYCFWFKRTRIRWSDNYCHEIAGGSDYVSGLVRSYLDQATKLGSVACLCTVMANLIPCLASMENKTILANVIAITIPTFKQILEFNYQASCKRTLDDLDNYGTFWLRN